MKPFSFFFLSLILLLNACGDPKQNTETKAPATDSIAQETGEEDGPPFEKECLCDFHDFGEYKISNTEYHIYKRGKGWDPQLYACSWTWGEDIHNVFPNDTLVKSWKIHLLDLEHFEIPNNGTEYGADSIKKYVIAVYTYGSGQGSGRCVFDPFNTGKYPKPQWFAE